VRRNIFTAFIGAIPILAVFKYMLATPEERRFKPYYPKVLYDKYLHGSNDEEHH
jgi:uncharacterized membrane protein